MAERIASSPDVIDEKYGVDSDVTKKVDEAFEQRATYLNDLKGLSTYTAELPDQAADDIYERLSEHERRVAPNLLKDEYGEGTASYDDELLIESSDGPLAISADHATDPVRKATGIREGADHGTAGIALLLNENGQGSVVLPRGRQTGNVNVDIEHVAKDALADIAPSKQGFLSVHGMIPGKFVHQYDPTEIHGVIGLGVRPTELSRDAASQFMARVKDAYGLKLVVGNDTPFFGADNTPRLPRDEEGNPKYAARLAAAGEGSTTNFINGMELAIPAMQIEISRSLRLLPREMEYRDLRARKLAVAMGYLMTKDLAAEILK